MKLRPHRRGQDKQLVTFGQIHGTITSKIQANYDNGTNIVNLIWVSDIVDIDGTAPEHNISEEKYVKKEESKQRSFDIRYKKEIDLRMERRTTLERNRTKEYANIFNKYCS